MNAVTYLLWILGLFALVLFFEGLFLLWAGHFGAEARRLRMRLDFATSRARPATSMVKSRRLSSRPAFDRILQAVPGIWRVERLLKQGGLHMTVGAFLVAMACCGATGFLAALIFGAPPMVAVAATLATALLPVLYASRERERRLARIEEQLPDMLELLARAMRAGHAFPSALQMAADEMPEPCAGEVATTFEEINFGVPVSTALMNMAQRVPSTDLRYFAVAVSIQRDTGGNLAELLTGISTVIRARFKFLRSVRTLTAEGRLSAWILVILPFALAGVITIVNPGFIRVLWTDPMGIQMLWGALAMMCFGVFWMTRLVKVRV